MTGREAFEIWAPAGALWVDWVRPVPFINPDSHGSSGLDGLDIPQLFYTEGLDETCAVFLDLPNYHAVEEGLALAALGRRPVPLYNGSSAQPGIKSLVDNSDIEAALLFGAEALKKLKLPEDAPPVFLLDDDRMQQFKMDVSLFDNSWDLYSQDIPTAGYFIKHGVSKIILRGERINKDLKSIFYDFQKKGMKIYFTNGYEKAKEVSIKKPLKQQ